MQDPSLSTLINIALLFLEICECQVQVSDGKVSLSVS